MSVEFLLGEVVKSKGTGRDKPSTSVLLVTYIQSMAHVYSSTSSDTDFGGGTVKPLYSAHPWDVANWLLYKGGLIIQCTFNRELLIGTLLGGCFREVTFLCTGLRCGCFRHISLYNTLCQMMRKCNNFNIYDCVFLGKTVLDRSYSRDFFTMCIIAHCGTLYFRIQHRLSWYTL